MKQLFLKLYCSASDLGLVIVFEKLTRSCFFPKLHSNPLCYYLNYIYIWSEMWRL